MIWISGLIVRLNPDFDCCNSFALSQVDKVTTAAECFVIVSGNVIACLVAAFGITQFADQAIMRLISQLTNDISRVLQKLVKYFKETIISTVFVQLLSAEPAIYCLSLNEALLP